MISEESLRLFSFPIRIGSFMCWIPFKWNVKQRMLERREDTIWYWVSIANILGQIVFILCISTHPIQTGLELQEMLRFLYPLFLTLLVLSTQFHMLLRHDDTYCTINLLLILNKTLAEGEDRLRKDGVEWIIKTGNLLLCSIIVFAELLFISMISLNVPPFLVFNTGSLMYNAIIGIYLSYFTILDVLFVCIFVYSHILYVNATTAWLEEIWFDESCTEMEEERRRGLYRIHQLLNDMENVSVREVAAAVIFTASILMIVSLYSTIKFSSEVNPMYPVTALSILIAMKIILKLVCAIQDNSSEFVRSFERRGKHLSAYSVRFLKACPPMHVHVGSFFKISGQTFIAIMYEFVLQTVIDLLLA